jgi:excisionase family DNA binding protein
VSELPGENGSPVQLLRPAEVAQRLDVSTSWVYEAAKDGRIPSVRLGGPSGPLRFIEEDVAAWVERARAAWRPTDTAAATLHRLS